MYSTGNYTQYLVITYNGKKSEKVYIYIYIYTHTHITESLCCTLEKTQNCQLTVPQFLKSVLRASQLAIVVKNLPANEGDMRYVFDLWVGKISWRMAWQHTPVFMPGESQGQRNLEGYSP